MNSLHVHQPGLLTTIQDRGRSTSRRYGVPVGGAMDLFSLRVANLLVGNPDDAAALECTVTGPDVSFTEDTWLALCGAEARGVLRAKPFLLPAEKVLSLRHLKKGCRAYLAIAGGLEVPRVLGSAATYTRGEFGGLNGRALRAGDRVVLGPSSVSYQDVEYWSLASDFIPPHNTDAEVRFVPGPQWNWFSQEAIDGFQLEPFRVLPQSDRMGVRLAGAPVRPTSRNEMNSEPVCAGAIQVPPDGQPIVLMADCQTIGGYPKIGHVVSVDLPVVAQLRAGEILRFRECSLEHAHKLLLCREAALAKLRLGLEEKQQ